MLEFTGLEKILSKIRGAERVHQVRKTHPEKGQQQFARQFAQQFKKDHALASSEEDEVIIGGERHRGSETGKKGYQGQDKEGDKGESDEPAPWVVSHPTGPALPEGRNLTAIGSHIDVVA